VPCKTKSLSHVSCAPAWSIRVRFLWKNSLTIDWARDSLLADRPNRFLAMLLSTPAYLGRDRIGGFSPTSAGQIQELIEPDSGVSPTSAHVCTVDSRPRVRNSGLFNIYKLLAGDLSGHRITRVFYMSPKPSASNEVQAWYTKASTRSPLSGLSRASDLKRY
jgi:hypothetical protein